MQFDHLLHWVPDLEAAMRAYQGLGFTIQPGGEHPGVGTRNAAWRIDDRYIELITLHDQGVARAGFGPAWPAIEATLRAGGGGLAFAVLVSDVAATVAALRARGVSVQDMQSRLPAATRRLHRDLGAWLPLRRSCLGAVLDQLRRLGAGVEQPLRGAGIPDRSVVAGSRGRGGA